jgi:PhzF family phenazine biosynthesis protein
MKLPLFQIDAFAVHIFSGNPAVVVPLHDWLSDETMQNIAMENQLSETAFLSKKNPAIACTGSLP